MFNQGVFTNPNVIVVKKLYTSATEFNNDMNAGGYTFATGVTPTHNGDPTTVIVPLWAMFFNWPTSTKNVTNARLVNDAGSDISGLIASVSINDYWYEPISQTILFSASSDIRFRADVIAAGTFNFEIWLAYQRVTALNTTYF